MLGLFHVLFCGRSSVRFSFICGTECKEQEGLWVRKWNMARKVRRVRKNVERLELVRSVNEGTEPWVSETWLGGSVECSEDDGSDSGGEEWEWRVVIVTGFSNGELDAWIVGSTRVMVRRVVYWCVGDGWRDGNGCGFRPESACVTAYGFVLSILTDDSSFLSF